MNAPPPSYILVVDDTEKNSRLLVDLLTAKGYRARAEASGEAALTSIEAEPPDMVLLDVMMPGLSGYDVCQRLRADPRNTFLPIVLVTALDPAKERVHGLEVGADDFLSKPINPAELLARVRSLLRVKALHDEVLRWRAGEDASTDVPGSNDTRNRVVLSLAFTGLHSRPADEAVSWLDRLGRELRDKAATEGGWVARLDADAAVVLFDGNDPTPALRLAQAMGTEAAAGVTAGPVWVGQVAGVQVAMGEPVETGGALARAADPGSLLADAACSGKSLGVRFEPCEIAHRDGHAVPAWRLVGPTAQ